MQRYTDTATVDNTVIVSKEEYESLKEDRKFLQALESAGVDSWEGYEYAQDIMEGD